MHGRSQWAPRRDHVADGCFSGDDILASHARLATVGFAIYASSIRR